MKPHRPDPDQGLFPWVWSDPLDDRPDTLADDDPGDRTPPLRGRVRELAAPVVTRELWGQSVNVRNARAGAYSEP